MVKRQKVDGGHPSTLPPQGGWAGGVSQTVEQEAETVLKIIQTLPSPVLAWGEV